MNYFQYLKNRLLGASVCAAVAILLMLIVMLLGGCDSELKSPVQILLDETNESLEPKVEQFVTTQRLDDAASCYKTHQTLNETYLVELDKKCVDNLWIDFVKVSPDDSFVSLYNSVAIGDNSALGQEFAIRGRVVVAETPKENPGRTTDLLTLIPLKAVVWTKPLLTFRIFAPLNKYKTGDIITIKVIVARITPLNDKSSKISGMRIVSLRDSQQPIVNP